MSFILLVGMLAYTGGLHSQQTKFESTPVRDCIQVSNTRPGIGHGYSGVVKNEDYDFTAHIPTGMIGWGGVVEGAPFHGFTIFWTQKERAVFGSKFMFG